MAPAETHFRTCPPSHLIVSLTPATPALEQTQGHAASFSARHGREYVPARFRRRSRGEQPVQHRDELLHRRLPGTEDLAGAPVS